MPNPQSFETERLLLRPTSAEDAKFMLELLNTPKWLKYIGDRNVKTEAEAKIYINTRIQPQIDRLGFANYTVIRKSDLKKIGTCGLFDREGLEGIDIGFAFLPEFEKKGYAFESASKIMEIGKEVFGIKQISAFTIKENFDSQKLLEKIGLHFSKIIHLPDDETELYLYE